MKALSFEGNGLEYFKIWIVNILLTIVTLGLYYPWAKVRNNRYFYANTKLEGRNFDYHATGKQLFKGYLIAMGLLIVYIVLQRLSPILSLVVLIIFFLALPWIIWRSLTFSMSVTSFSNVRFEFNGHLKGAYIVYLLLPIAAFIAFYSPIIVIAIFSPIIVSKVLGVVGGILAGVALLISIVFVLFMYGLLKQKSTSYYLNNLKYGQGKFATQLTVGGFAKIAAKTVGLALLAFIVCMVIIGVLATVSGVTGKLLGMVGNLQDPAAITEIMTGGVVALVALVYLGFILISVAIFSYLYTRKRAYIMDNSTLDKKISFQSTLSARDLAFISVTNFLVIIFSLGLAIPWAKVRLSRYVLENTRVNTSLGFEEYVTQQEEKQASLGEQIGDAFDVDVGIGI